ncbi:hypothetical protein CW740_05520 [Kangiella profundi]|uniref:Uncharacterized protein n=1 Tax=Kangiella profundi TaxID=1561924 RepID=A0A2K9ABD7_9GAMM|nr:hypothetical protein [Kangiella profundi]AUD78737.1 hypothetical protein CW740_05520 [Kangiella profundi]GGE89882.1 hypothetical protein GCM10011356_00110 [Kangiella profundi]
MKIISTLLAALILSACANHSGTHSGESTEEWLQQQYSLGIIYKEQPNHGLEVLLISQHSETFRSGLKSGWVLVSMDGVSLAQDGGALLSERLQDSSKPHNIMFEVDTGEQIIQMELMRERFGFKHNVKGSFIEVH